MAQPEIAEAVSAAMGQKIKPTYGYYRKRDGWIGIATITRLERVKYLERGWQHLGQYGAFDMTPYVASHPFDALFMFGGAKELPTEQVIQMGFHLDPPLVPTCRQHITQYHRRHSETCWQGAKPAEFPQLASVDSERLKPLPCEFCTRVLPTPQARQQHQQVAHKEEIGNLQTGRSLATALNERPVAPVADNTALLERIGRLEAQLAERPAAQTASAKAHQRTCEVCQQVLESSTAAGVRAKLTKHRKQSHRSETLSAPR